MQYIKTPIGAVQIQWSGKGKLRPWIHPEYKAWGYWKEDNEVFLIFGRLSIVLISRRTLVREVRGKKDRIKFLWESF